MKNGLLELAGAVGGPCCSIIGGRISLTTGLNNCWIERVEVVPGIFPVAAGFITAWLLSGWSMDTGLPPWSAWLAAKVCGTGAADSPEEGLIGKVSCFGLAIAPSDVLIGTF